MNYLKWQCAVADIFVVASSAYKYWYSTNGSQYANHCQDITKKQFKAHFVVTILIVLTLASDLTVLHENDAFSILVLSTKKRNSSFLKKIFVFQKIYFKFKLLKTFNIFTDCHIKACQSLKQRAILKIPSTVF